MPDLPYTLTAALHQEEDWYIAQCLEVDVASQGHTIEEALANLAEAVELVPGGSRRPRRARHGDATRDILPTARRVSPVLSDVPVRKVIRALETIGFSHARTRGSHAVYRNQEGRAV